jgi:hypothetical protein
MAGPFFFEPGSVTSYPVRSRRCPRSRGIFRFGRFFPDLRHKTRFCATLFMAAFFSLPETGPRVSKERLEDAVSAHGALAGKRARRRRVGRARGSGFESGQGALHQRQSRPEDRGSRQGPVQAAREQRHRNRADAAELRRRDRRGHLSWRVPGLRRAADSVRVRRRGNARGDVHDPRDLSERRHGRAHLPLLLRRQQGRVPEDARADAPRPRRAHEGLQEARRVAEAGREGGGAAPLHLPQPVQHL